MEITNLGVNNTPLPPQPQVEPAGYSCSDQPGSSITPKSSMYSTSPELQGLLNQMRSQPAVRGDLVQQAVQRLQQGYYHSQTSIQQTAQSMLQAAD